MATTFQREKFDQCIAEAMPLLVEHYDEIAHYPDIELDPAMEEYRALEAIGNLRIFTARQDGNLIGYAVFFVRRNLHYRKSVQASQDILFVRKVNRAATIGWRLIEFCDEQLKSEGVQAVYQHVKRAHNFGPLLEKMGYELVDLIYARRLD